jgi:hypothetical protein
LKSWVSCRAFDSYFCFWEIDYCFNSAKQLYAAILPDSAIVRDMDDFSSAKRSACTEVRDGSNSEG